MNKKINKINKTNKIEIFYMKETGLFCGAGFLDYFKVNEYLNLELQNNNTIDCEFHCLGSLINKQKQFKDNIDKNIKKSKQDKILKEIKEKILSITIDFDKWKDFISKGYDIIKIINGKLVGEVKEKTIEEIKNSLFWIRNCYLKQTADKFGDDWESCPKEIKNKRKKAREEINEIEKINNLEDLKKYEK
jgi:hypothetical protein